MNNLLSNYLFLGGITSHARPLYYDLYCRTGNLHSYMAKNTDFIGSSMPNASSLAKQFTPQSCFYLVEDAYFNVFNRDRLVHDFFFEFFYSIEKAIG